MEEHIRDILRALGEDPDREGLQKTPQRVTQALSFLTRGYAINQGKSSMRRFSPKTTRR